MAELIPIAVDLGDVAGAIGSQDQRLVQRLVRKYAKELRTIDGRVADLEEEGVEDEEDERRVSPKALIRGLRTAGDNPRTRQRCKRDLALLVQTRGLARLGNDLDRSQAEIEKSQGLSRRDKKAINAALTELLMEVLGAEEDDAEPDRAPGGGPGAPRASTADVVRHLVMGGEPKRRVPFKFMYGHALRYLCAHFGTELPHERWSDLRDDRWADAVDAALRAAGVPAKVLSVGGLAPDGSPQVGHLAERGPPLPIPRYRESGPQIGYLKGAEIGRALKALRGAGLSRLDPELRALLEDVRDWLQTCADSKRDLVCFCD